MYLLSVAWWCKNCVQSCNICTLLEKSCGSLPEFPNGKYTYPSGILFGATAVAQCDEG